MQFCRILTVVTTLFFLSCSGSNNHLKRKHKTGDVKSIVSLAYKGVLKSGQAEKTSLEGKTIEEYDDKGVLETITSFNKNGNIKDLVRHVYDKKNKEVAVNTFDSRLLLTDKVIPKYDANGLVVEKTKYSPEGKILCIYRFKYDKRGNPIVRSSFSSENTLLATITSRFDEEDRKIEETEVFSSGLDDFNCSTRFSYKNNGDLLEERCYGNDGKLRSTINYVYSYDKVGNWVSRHAINEDGRSTVTEREFIYQK